MAPYFERPDGEYPVYIELRIGDYQHELGMRSSRYAPKGAGGPGGAIVYWHVDDGAAALERLLAKGATDIEPLTQRGEGFVTAAVADPCGNILGIVCHQRSLDSLNSLCKLSASQTAECTACGSRFLPGKGAGS
jgi:predicted enzyme related to lactoylglutathione lyase